MSDDYPADLFKWQVRCRELEAENKRLRATLHSIASHIEGVGHYTRVRPKWILTQIKKVPWEQAALAEGEKGASDEP